MNQTLTRRQLGERIAALASAAAAFRCSGPTVPEEKSAQDDLLARSIVLDLHCDTPMLILDEGYDLGQRHGYGQVDIPRMRDGGVTGVFFSIYTPAGNRPEPESMERALEIIDATKREVERHPRDLVLAATADEIVQAKKDGKIAILMGIEGGHMIASSLENLRTLFLRGGRYLTLTHGAHTPWAGSSGKSPAPYGLTDFGREVVREMNRLGMMVDVSHVADQTFFDVIEATKAPVIASHSSCRALASHPRNMTDEMIQALAKNGGVIHINYYNSFLDDGHRTRSNALEDLDEQENAVRAKFAGDPARRSRELRQLAQKRLEIIGRVPLSRLLDHVAHAAAVAGIDHVGLGSDFDGVDDQLPQGMEDISKIPNLITGLRERGFTDAGIEKILGANTLRVMREVERIAAEGAGSPSAA